MKKTLLALAVLATFTGSASAQSSVTLYGIIDAAVVGESGNKAGSVTKLTGGAASGSRLGFRAKEDLGDGLFATFVLEGGFSTDNGTTPQGYSGANPNGITWGRQSFVGLGGNFGTVTLGRQYTSYLTTLVASDPFGLGMAGQATNVMSPTGSNGRVNNAIKYITPKLNGFTGELLYVLGEVTGDTSIGRTLGFAAAYMNGPLSVRLAYNNENSPTFNALNGRPSTDVTKNTLLAANYNFGSATGYLGYAINKGATVYLGNAHFLGTTTAYSPYTPTTTTTAAAAIAASLHPSLDSTDVLVGITVPFGASKIIASYIRHNDKTANDNSANQFGVGYTYALSKRTDLYAAYAVINNKNGSGYTVGNAGDVLFGSGDKAYNLGVRHSF